MRAYVLSVKFQCYPATRDMNRVMLIGSANRHSSLFKICREIIISGANKTTRCFVGMRPEKYQFKQLERVIGDLPPFHLTRVFVNDTR